MKNIFLLLTACSLCVPSWGQQNYNDFEGSRYAYFGYSSGVLDSLALNPLPGPVDTSAHCARYVRDTILYDNLQIHPNNKLTDVSNYANGGLLAPHITMKLFTTAPAGTQIKLQLGSSSISGYPAGVHSEYIASTTVQNGWQNVSFNFLQLTPGGTVSSSNIDKIVILFDAGSAATDTMYIDDLTGPSLAPVGIATYESLSGFRLYQNSPNPAKELTHINFQLNSPGDVSLRLYDMLGNPVSSLLEQNLKAGSYSIPVETADMPNGIYFYVLKKEGTSRSMKMIVSR